MGRVMLLNCEHEDCNECLELAEACSGIRFNSMVMLAQVVKNIAGDRSWSKFYSSSRSWYKFGDCDRSWFKSGFLSGSGSGVRFGCSYWSRSNPY